MRHYLSALIALVLAVLAAEALPVGASVYSGQSFNSGMLPAKNGLIGPAAAQGLERRIGLPELTGRIVDNAGMLSPSQEQALTSELEAFEKRSSDQVVVATIESLQGENLEDFANRLFRKWQLGQEGINNGVLFLVSKNDRKIRIEVGYGLEGTLTDALAKVIIETVIVPRFRQGDFGGGIVEGTQFIVRVLSGDVAELEDRKKRNEQNSSGETDWVAVVFFIIWGTFFFGPIIFAIGAPIFGKKIGKRRYRWLGIETTYGGTGSGRRGSSSGGSWSGGGGGFSGGGGSSGGGGASGGW